MKGSGWKLKCKLPVRHLAGGPSLSALDFRRGGEGDAHRPPIGFVLKEMPEMAPELTFQHGMMKSLLS